MDERTVCSNPNDERTCLQERSTGVAQVDASPVSLETGGSPGKAKPSGKQLKLLAQWVYDTITLTNVRVRVRPQANHLHILCEGPECPEEWTVASRLVKGLTTITLEQFLPPEQPQIYQVYLYGRSVGQAQATWTHIIYLNQLDRHLEHLQTLAEPTSDPVPVVEDVPAELDDQEPTEPQLRSPIPKTSALLVSNKTLARQGYPDAIARYLSETLSKLGVAVEVTVKTIPYVPKPGESLATVPQNYRRLWILCQSVYSPDPSLVADPVAQQLRELKLEEFRDALIFCRVTGEAAPDWVLRIDLTPVEEMLREWGRWGDGRAIAQLLNQALEPYRTTAKVSIKESTLHVICTLTEAAIAAGLNTPNQQRVKAIVAPLLERLAPQAILATMIYGQRLDQNLPAWVEWLRLPASEHSALAESPMALARQGDQPALVFLLHRLLNPDLNQRLATGGIRIQLLRRNQLLHIMADAPTCPDRQRVIPPVVRLLRQLKLDGVEGVRIYGRRAGQQRPLWSYGTDFIRRGRLVPEATPEFAASEDYVGALIMQPTDVALQPELTSDAVMEVSLVETLQQGLKSVQQFLIRTQLFATSDQAGVLAGAITRDLEPESLEVTRKDGRAALVWGALGLVLLFGIDRILGQVLQNQAAQAALVKVDPNAKSSPPAGMIPPANAVSAPTPATETQPLALPKLSLNKSNQRSGTVFNSSGFTQSGTTDGTASPGTVPATAPGDTIPSVESTGQVTLQDSTNPQALPPGQLAPGAPAATSSPPMTVRPGMISSRYPTFNSKQLDQQLALYQKRLAESGPPDILIVGSSRALRGVDPTALQNALVAQGYPKPKIFNFGINGATAQVVNLLLRDFLTPEQLPKMIVWADGARALNSGRLDITYNGVVASQGYQKLTEGRSPSAAPTVASNPAQSEASAETPAATTTTTTQSKNVLAEGYNSLNSWVNQALSTISLTYAHRDQLQVLLRDQLAAVFPQRKLTTEQIALQQNLLKTTQAKQPGQRSPGQQGTLDPEANKDNLLESVDFDGFMSLSTRFNPTTYYQKYARVSGDYDSDYENFQLEGKQAEAMTQVLEFVQTHQIKLVFVNLPLTQDYLDPVRSEHEQAFLTYMLQLATERGFVFRDLGQIWSYETDYFSDPSHLNRYGAYEVSHRLALDPMISWPQSK